MSSRITNGLARRLPRRTCLPNHGLAGGIWVDSSPHARATTTRTYAKAYKIVPHPSQSPKSIRPVAASESSSLRALKSLNQSIPKTASGPERLLFSLDDVPRLGEWITSLENLDNSDLDAKECMKEAQRYVEVATQYESRWRHKLEEECGLTPDRLHWLGILLISGNKASRWKLGTHILRSASELGYAPSTLTLVRTFRSMPKEVFASRVAGSRHFIDADARFQALVSGGADPDALTLQGVILAGEGHSKRAMQMFRRAEDAWKKKKTHEAGAAAAAAAAATGAASTVGGEGTASRKPRATAPATAGQDDDYVLPPPRLPRWEWEVSCVLFQADILRAQGAISEAERLYRVAALELDNPRAFLQLAELLRGSARDGPERRAFVLKAAISGERDACREMGELEKAAAARTGLSSRERAERDRVSMEWFRLANGEGLEAAISGLVAESGQE